MYYSKNYFYFYIYVIFIHKWVNKIKLVPIKTEMTMPSWLKFRKMFDLFNKGLYNIYVAMLHFCINSNVESAGNLSTYHGSIILPFYKIIEGIMAPITLPQAKIVKLSPCFLARKCTIFLELFRINIWIYMQTDKTHFFIQIKYFLGRPWDYCLLQPFVI